MALDNWGDHGLHLLGEPTSGLDSLRIDARKTEALRAVEQAQRAADRPARRHAELRLPRNGRDQVFHLTLLRRGSRLRHAQARRTWRWVATSQ